MNLEDSNIFSVMKNTSGKIITDKKSNVEVNVIDCKSHRSSNVSPSDCLRIYHGSPREIVAQFGKGKENNDYGKAFYCTEDKYQADLWAVARTGSGFVYEYEIDTTNLNVLRITEKDVLLWLAILMSNREVSDLSIAGEINLKLFLDKYLTVDVNVYDVIIGYRADDSYFKFASAFIEGILTFDYLEEAMKLGNLGYQVAIKSKEAFNRLKLVNVHSLKSTALQKDYVNRDRIARNTYIDYERKSANDRIRNKNKVKDIYTFLNGGND